MSLGEDIEAFDSLKNLERIFIKKNKHRRISIQTEDNQILLKFFL